MELNGRQEEVEVLLQESYTKGIGLLSDKGKIFTCLFVFEIKSANIRIDVVGCKYSFRSKYERIFSKY